MNELHELSQPTEEGVLVGSGGMKARLLKSRHVIAWKVIMTVELVDLKAGADPKQ